MSGEELDRPMLEPHDRHNPRSDGAGEAEGAPDGPSASRVGLEVEDDAAQSGGGVRVVRRRQLVQDMGALVLVLAAIGVTTLAVPQFEQEFFLSDVTLQHTHHHDTITNATLVGLCGVVPAVCVVVVGWVLRSPVWRVVNEVVGFLQAHAVNAFTMLFFKLHVGRPRPDFLARCDVSSSCSDEGPCSADMCQHNNNDLDVGYRSFFSGHASTAFTGMCFLSLFLAMHLQPMGKGSLLLLVVCVAPLYTAAFVAITRLQDNLHHWEDVLVGSVVGIVCAYVCHVLTQRRAFKYDVRPVRVSQ